MIEAGLITKEQYETGMQKHAKTQVALRKILIKEGFVSEDKMMEFLANVLEIPFIKDIYGQIISPDIIECIPEQSCRQYEVMPLYKKDNILTVATTDPFDVFVIDDLEGIAKCKINMVLSKQQEIIKAIDTYYGEKGSLEEIVKVMEEEEADLKIVDESERMQAVVEGETEIVDAPIIRLVNTMINQAIKDRASDIHIEPDEKKLGIRYRIDGVLREAMVPPKRLQPAIISRIKIMAGMDISIKRAPQDGRFKIKVENRDIDVRISSVPTIYGEKVVLRLLDQVNIRRGLEDAGFSLDCLRQLQEMIERPYGIILVTGPTGSGKTTTLYLALQVINSPEKNIITIEEPVEYDLERINQISVNIKAGVTFAKGLRSILRQDPDVIMVGEMRDLETADVAVRAALTGHLVLSTLHTNDAPSSIVRLIDMGVPPYLVTSSVCCVLAQRLVRSICSDCKEAYKPAPHVLAEEGLDAVSKDYTFYRGKGCETCGNTGYFGRTGLFELMVIDKELRSIIHAGKSSDTLREAAQKAGMKTLWEDGLQKVLEGVTTIEEVKRVAFAEQE